MCIASLFDWGKLSIVQAFKILARNCNTRCVYVVIGFVVMSIDRILTTAFIFEVEDK